MWRIKGEVWRTTESWWRWQQDAGLEYSTHDIIDFSKLNSPLSCCICEQNLPLRFAHRRLAVQKPTLEVSFFTTFHHSGAIFLLYSAGLLFKASAQHQQQFYEYLGWRSLMRVTIKQSPPTSGLQPELLDIRADGLKPACKDADVLRGCCWSSLSCRLLCHPPHTLPLITVFSSSSLPFVPVLTPSIWLFVN